MARRKPTGVESWRQSKDWHAAHADQMTIGQKIADAVAAGMGSWTFIIAQTAFVVGWMVLNVVEFVTHKWDPYPFILLNLVFSTQAAYAAPIIMMSQNRSAERDRFQATADYHTNIEAKNDIERVQKELSRIEIDKLDRILGILAEPEAGQATAREGGIEPA
jgi:uncharacterized membrane protein